MNKLFFRFSPEIQKNIWLHLSQARLVAAPVLLAIIYLSAFRFSSLRLIIKSGDEVASKTLAGISLAILCVSAVSAVFCCFKSVASEVRERTWDFQRLASVKALSMALGKIFGPAVFPLYVFTIAFFVLLVSASFFTPLAEVVLGAVTILLTLVFALSLSTLLGLSFVIQGRISRESRSSLGCLLPFFVIYLGASIFQFVTGSVGLEPGLADPQSIVWFGRSYDAVFFSRLSLFVFTFWSVVGVVRLFSSELQYSIGPGVWLLFVCFLIVYLCGFPTGAGLSRLFEGLSQFSIAVLVAVGSAYVTVFLENKSPVLLRKFLNKLKKGNLPEIWRNTPRWLVSLLLAVFLVLVLGLYLFDDWGTPLRLSSILVLMGARDIFVILGLNFSNKSQSKKDLAALLFLASLYVLLPVFLGGYGRSGLGSFFFPFIKAGSTSGLIYAGVWAGLGLGWLVYRWRKFSGEELARI